MLKYHLNLVPVCYQNHSIFAPNSIPKTHLKSTWFLDAVLVSKIHENEAKREPKILGRNCANRAWTLLSLPSLLSDGHVPSKIPQNALSRPPRVLPEHLKATKTASETACIKASKQFLNEYLKQTSFAPWVMQFRFNTLVSAQSISVTSTFTIRSSPSKVYTLQYLVHSS